MLAMSYSRPLALLLAACVAQAAGAQVPDPAEQRARLANQRIQAEAARRAEEERAREEMAAQAAAAQPATPGQAENPDVAAAASPAVPPLYEGGQPQSAGQAEAARQARDAQTSRALEQLRQLGELRDAGYVTEQEFERIKARILDDRF